MFKLKDWYLKKKKWFMKYLKIKNHWQNYRALEKFFDWSIISFKQIILIYFQLQRIIFKIQHNLFGDKFLLAFFFIFLFFWHGFHFFSCSFSRLFFSFLLLFIRWFFFFYNLFFVDRFRFNLKKNIKITLMWLTLLPCINIKDKMRNTNNQGDNIKVK